MKIYELVGDDVNAIVLAMMKKFHPELLKAEVKVEAIFIFHEDESDISPALEHGGYPALAVVRAVPVKDRAAGRGDAEIVIDRDAWMKLSPKRRDALIDHELEHVVLDTEGKTKIPKVDGAGRPKLKTKRHDRQFGWFDIVAKRHGEFSGEIVQARQLIEQAGQLYFDLPDAGKVVSMSKADLQEASAAAR